MNNTDSLIAYIIKTHPQVIFWDIGKVLVSLDFRTENRLTAEHFNIPYDDFRSLIKSYFHEYVAGNISNEEIDQLFTDKFGVTESVTSYQHSIYHQIIRINDELLSLLPNISTDIQQSVISNIFPDTLADL